MDMSMENIEECEEYERGHGHEGEDAGASMTVAGLRGGRAEGPPELRRDHGRCVVHFDIDSFYAQVEEVLDPRLKGKPIGIRQKYLLVTCNYTARRMGAKKMESVVEAKKRCPSLIVMDGEDLSRYREASEVIFSYVAGVCGPLVQRLGMDEIFADITEYIRGGGTAETHDESGDMANEASQLVGPWTGDGSAIGFTGHVYTPGGGGHLLEAQTGLEISLASTTSDDNDKDMVEVAGKLSRDHAASIRGDSSTQSSHASEDSTTVISTITAQSSSSQHGENIEEHPAAVTTAGGCGERVGECRCGCIERLAKASAFAERVRRGLRDEVGYTCSAGIGCSKAAAKLAGELHKPDQQTTILPEHSMSMMAQLPLRKLPGCGHSTSAKIKAELGITETRQLQKAPWLLLVRVVGHKLAKGLYLLSRGEDLTPVVPSVRPKTMSDEDSFKRGSVRSRTQVERHIKRLTAPLLLRAGERVRNYKEAPETLRLGVRRASKGYGHRITRQCAISSGFAAAWGAVGEDVAAAAAANAGGLPASWKAVGAAEAIATETPVGVGVRQSIPMQTTGPEAETKSTDSGQTSVDCGRMPIGCSTQTQSQKSVDGKREASPGHGDGSTEKMHATSTPSQIAISAQQSDRANEALSEVVRLAMVMFDKIIPAGEHMDITLLSVGLAGFRNLCGSAQTGIARFLETSEIIEQGRRVARRVGNGVGSSTTSPRGSSASQASQSSSMSHSQRLMRRSSPIASQSSVASVTEGRLRIGDAIIHPGVSSGTTAAIARSDTGTEARAPGGTGAGNDWEQAEVLVVAAGGQNVEGRGSLDWCWRCGVHVLHEDMEEHLASEFHEMHV